jgi:plastocyanin
MRRSVFIAGLTAALVLGKGGFAIGWKGSVTRAQQNASATDVKIGNFSFRPIILTVPVGTTVTWTNRDDIAQTLVSTDDPKTFKYRVLDTDENVFFTFTKPGTYPYFCSIHPRMIGKVIGHYGEEGTCIRST